MSEQTAIPGETPDDSDSDIMILDEVGKDGPLDAPVDAPVVAGVNVFVTAVVEEPLSDTNSPPE